MSDQPKPKKKLNRFAKKYKGDKKKVETFKPEESQPKKLNRFKEPNPPKKLTDETEEQKELYNKNYQNYVYFVDRLNERLDEIEKKFNEFPKDMDSAGPEVQKQYMILMLQKNCLSGVTLDLETFKNRFMPNFTEEETNSILQDYFLYNKIIIMETNMTGWKESFGVIRNTCKTFLGIIVKERFNELDILKNDKINKKKNTIKTVHNVTTEPTFKKIVFSPEEIIHKNDLVAQALKEEVKMFNDKKEPLILIFIGHVDSGKSTISGNILYLSGKVDETEMRRFKAEADEKDRESWYVAYIMDINEEEREKGKTIEVGRATFETPHKRFTILDCPGHRNYVQNMISGAAQADVACLIVSAKPGEFEAGFEKDGQTREHAMLAKSLGAKHLVVCINKMDTVNWDKSRVDYIKKNITPFLVTSCNFEENKINWVCVEGLSGKNIKDPIKDECASWYDGKSLFRTFDALPRFERPKKNIIRFPVLDKISLQGNLYVFGKVESGIIRSNMKLVLMPNQKEFTVLKLLDDDDEEIAFAEAGESLKLIIKDLEKEEFKRGSVICGLQYWINVCYEFEAEIKVLDLLPVHFFGPGFTVIIHMHTILEECTITKLVKKITDNGEEDKKPSKFLKSQDRGIIRIKTKNPICLEKFSEFTELGRFALRKETMTVAVGEVTKFKPINKNLLKDNYYFKESK